MGEAISYEKATHWYKKAAEQGDKTAQFNLGICYCDGKGVKKDYNEAEYWLTKAAKQGHESAKNALNELRRKSLIKKSPNVKKDVERRTNITKNTVKTNLSYWGLLFWGVFFIGALIGSYYLFKSERFLDAAKWMLDPQHKISVHTWNHWWYLGSDPSYYQWTLLSGLRAEPLLLIVQVVAGLAECLWWLFTAILWLVSWAILGGLGCILYGLPGIICFFAIGTIVNMVNKASKRVISLIISVVLILTFIGGTVYTYLQLFNL